MRSVQWLAVFGIAISAIFFIESLLSGMFGSSDATQTPLNPGTHSQQAWVMPVAILIILAVTIFLGRGAMGQIDNLTVGDREKTKAFRLKIAFWAVLALSAVSFSTTLFGMVKFLSPKDVGESLAFTWFVSSGSTLGIQALMLVMALLLGDYLMRMQPVSSVLMIEELEKQGRSKNALEALYELANSVRFWASSFVFLLLVLAYLLYRDGTLSLFGYWQYETSGAGLSLPVILCVSLALMVAVKSDLVGRSWNMIAILFLTFVYVGTLLVSSLFSFDAYYSVLQSDKEQKAAGDSVVIEQTGRILTRANAHFADVIDERRRKFRQDGEYRQLERSINALINKSKQYESNVRSELAKTQNEILAQKRKLQEAQAQEALTLSNLQKDLATSKVRVEKLRREIVNLKNTIAANELKLKPLLADIAKEEAALTEIFKEREREATGSDGRPGGKKQKWRKLNAQYNAKQTYINSLKAEIEPDQQQLATNQKSLERALADLQLAGADVLSDQSKLTAFQPQTTGQTIGMSQTSIAGQGLSELQKQQQSIGTLNARQVSDALAKFTRDFTRTTYDNYIDQCTLVHNILLSVAQGSNGGTDQDILDFSCKPISFESNVNRLLDLMSKKASFEKACIPENTKVASSTNDSASPADLDDAQAAQLALQHTQRCLRLIPIPDATMDSLSNELLLLREENSSDGYDIRRSLSNLERGEKYARGAAALAVFVDLLILVVGLIMAMLQESKLNSNPHRPTAEQIELDIITAAQNHDPNNDYHAGLLCFFRYLEPNRQLHEVYTMELDLSRVSYHDRVLVNAILEAARPLLRINNQASTSAETIYTVDRLLVMTLNQLIGMKSAAQADANNGTGEGVFGFSTRTSRTSRGPSGPMQNARWSNTSRAARMKDITTIRPNRPKSNGAEKTSNPFKPAPDSQQPRSKDQGQQTPDGVKGTALIHNKEPSEQQPVKPTASNGIATPQQQSGESIDPPGRLAKGPHKGR